MRGRPARLALLYLSFLTSDLGRVPRLPRGTTVKTEMAGLIKEVSVDRGGPAAGI
jgi:hypothetical protein